MHYLILFAYWLIFWQRFLRNPYLLSTSEVASTYFPFWLSMGRKWKARDDIYYQYPACIPFLSMWYWPNVLVSKLSKFLSTDGAFKLYAYFILSHYLLASIIAYKLLGLFGAITLTYAGYCIKPQTPSFVYTMCWMPGMFIDGWFGIFSTAMAVLGGYWPILVYVIPVAGISHPVSLIGLVLGLPQIIPFMWYWKRSVRNGEKVDRDFGRLPWWKLKDLFWPTKSVGLINGVHYPEGEMYMGCTVALSFLSFQIGIYPFLGCIVLLLLGIIPPVQRIPMRAIYLLSILLTILACRNIYILDLKGVPITTVILLQAYLLLRNSNIYPSFPFSQWWKKPSELYAKFAYNGTWPNVTGYLRNVPISTYQGAFRLK